MYNKNRQFQPPRVPKAILFTTQHRYYAFASLTVQVHPEKGSLPPC